MAITSITPFFIVYVVNFEQVNVSWVCKSFPSQFLIIVKTVIIHNAYYRWLR